MLKSEMAAEIKTLEFVRLQYIEIIRELESDKASILQANNIMQSTIAGLESDNAVYDTALTHLEESEKSLVEKNNSLINANQKLIKKLEALEASLDVIAMAATAGLAVTEL